MIRNFKSKLSRFRLAFKLFCSKLIISKYFNYTIILIVIFLCLKLILDTYISNKPELQSIMLLLDIFFNCLFFCEAILKIIALGFWYGKNAYLK